MRTTWGGSAVAALLVAALVGGSMQEAAQGDVTRPPAPDRQKIPQTSDGLPGQLAPWVPRAQRGKATWTTRAAWQVAPGVTFEKFDLVDARGPIRGNLMTIDYAAAGISLDYLGGRKVASTSALLGTAVDDQAIAAVNGDFFDIGDTGAPLGVGRDRQRKLLHGLSGGWNNAFFIKNDGYPDIDTIYTTAKIKQHPEIEIQNVNSPSVRSGGVGLYTDKWGTLERHRVTDGQKTKVRMVIVKGGVVAANLRKFPKKLEVSGKVLIGRDAGARQLRGLKKGMPITVKARLDKRAKTAITGNVFLIKDGVRKARDDREMHPRTAIGIDYDTTTIYLLVVDGRQSFSRGYTMVELAKFFEFYGVDEALNLDGGGSSTMVGLRPNGKVKVLNSPSDGQQRQVPNGLGVFYDPTAPPLPPLPPVPPTPTATPTPTPPPPSGSVTMTPRP